MQGELAATAVNAPMVPAEVLRELEPYISLAEGLGRAAVQLVHAGGFNDVHITYASPRGDDLDTRLLRAMVIKGILEQITTSTVNLVNADVLAKQRGLRIFESTVPAAGKVRERAFVACGIYIVHMGICAVQVAWRCKNAMCNFLYAFLAPLLGRSARRPLRKTLSVEREVFLACKLQSQGHMSRFMLGHLVPDNYFQAQIKSSLHCKAHSGSAQDVKGCAQAHDLGGQRWSHSAHFALRRKSCPH